MKADCKHYKGIEYIVFDELPQTQREIFLQTLERDLFIKILIDGQIVSRCIQYKDYSTWFDTIYKTKILTVKEARVQEAIELRPNLA